jgi:hypothetical protein
MNCSRRWRLLGLQPVKGLMGLESRGREVASGVFGMGVLAAQGEVCSRGVCRSSQALVASCSMGTPTA